MGGLLTIDIGVTRLGPVLEFSDRAGLELLIIVGVRDVLQVDGLITRVRTTVEVR